MQICFVVEAMIQSKIETGPVSLQPKLGYFSSERSQRVGLENQNY